MLIWTDNAIYTIKKDDVVILAVLHTRLDVERMP